MIPSRTHGRRRDSHGRGLRGPILPQETPAWRSRAQKFDDVIATELAHYRSLLGARLDHFDFAVLDVPQSDPAPWEEGSPLARFLPFERPSKIHGRIIFYRMPILAAAEREPFPRMFMHDVVTGQIANALNVSPADIDYLR